MTPKAKALITLQKLVRLKAADDRGYCQCVSCGKYFHWKTGDGGHFLAKGASSYWALREENVHPQHKGCNGFGMRNGTAAIEYTRWMQDYYGDDFVQHMLETKNNPVKYYKKDLIDMTKEWEKEIKFHLERIGE